MNADLRILIVDDEPLARENLRLMLANRRGCRIIGEAGTVAEAREFLARTTIDLILLDVRMPGASGMELAATLDPRRPPVVIFATAHEEFAVAAFGVRATDYLLKPFDEQRLALAVERAVERCIEQSRPAAMRQLDALARQLRREASVAPPKAANPALPVDEGHLQFSDANRLIRLPLGDVVWFRSSHNYIRVQTAEWWHVMRLTLQELERHLDPAIFLRVHRTAIVNLGHVRDLRATAHGDHLLRLSNGTTVTVSRRRRAAIAQLRAIQESRLANTLPPSIGRWMDQLTD
jgi:two-component system LytT family response regulator